eukprot:1094988-Amphidinium_carterae.1
MSAQFFKLSCWVGVVSFLKVNILCCLRKLVCTNLSQGIHCAVVFNTFGWPAPNGEESNESLSSTEKTTCLLYTSPSPRDRG